MCLPLYSDYDSSWRQCYPVPARLEASIHNDLMRGHPSSSHNAHAQSNVPVLTPLMQLHMLYRFLAARHFQGVPQRTHVTRSKHAVCQGPPLDGLLFGLSLEGGPLTDWQKHQQDGRPPTGHANSVTRRPATSRPTRPATPQCSMPS